MTILDKDFGQTEADVPMLHSQSGIHFRRGLCLLRHFLRNVRNADDRNTQPFRSGQLCLHPVGHSLPAQPQFVADFQYPQSHLDTGLALCGNSIVQHLG